jgi:hypothetical protein
MSKKSNKNKEFEAKKRKINPKFLHKRKNSENFENEEDLYFDYERD